MTEWQDDPTGSTWHYVRDTYKPVWTLTDILQTDAGPVYRLGAPSSEGFRHWQSANPTQMREDYVRVDAP